DLEEQPSRPLAAAAPRLHTHQVPAALEPLALERESEVPLVEAEVRIAFRHPAAAIPDDHGAAAILALGDVALEIEVLHRMVLGLDREPLAVGDETRTVRHRPALEHAVELEAKVVMEPPGRVLLHHELAAEACLRRRRRLRSAVEIALLPVVLQQVLARLRLRFALACHHDHSLPISATGGRSAFRRA